MVNVSFLYNRNKNNGFILAVKTTIIHPATEKHIEKYSVQNVYMIDETPEIYKSITLPHIQGEQFDLQVKSSKQLFIFVVGRHAFKCQTKHNLKPSQNI